MIFAQTGGSLVVQVQDSSGSAVPGVQVELSLEAGGWQQELKTDAGGGVRFLNLPWQRFRLTASGAQLASATRTIAIRSNIPEEVVLVLGVAHSGESLTVVERSESTNIDPEQTGSRAQMSRETIDQLARSGGSRGLEQVLATFPGFAQNANGSIHPRGAHNQMTFVVDGMPISDQLGGAFANAIDPSIVETVELYTGNIPAEYGNKVSAVAQVTTRSGHGLGRKFTGVWNAQAGQFDSLSQGLSVAGEAGRFAWSGMGMTVKTHRYLDSVSLDNLHNGGNSERFFQRLDYQASNRDTIRLLFMGGRAGFESANLRSQQANRMDQRQDLSDLSVSGTWLHVIDASSTFESNLSLRSTRAQLLPSAGDTPVTAWQNRTAKTINLNARYSKIWGRHNLRIGVDSQHYPLHEQFRFAVTDPNFDPELADYTLPLGGKTFHFNAKDRGALQSGFFQDQVRMGRFTATLGLRYDSYRFLTHGAQWQPRLGLAYHLRETGTVFRIAYNRLYQTPPNENLLLSSSDEAGALAPPVVRQTFGGTTIRIRPEKQNFYEAGVQQSLGTWINFAGAVYHKDATNQQDNNNFFNTGIIFPIALASIRVNGAEARIEMKSRRGFTGNLSLTHARAISTPPFTGGLFIGNDAVAALSQGPFVIDHDQKLGASGMIAYRSQRGWFGTFSGRYDSGLVANPSDPREVAADPDYADLLPYVALDQRTPRVRPRTIYDLLIGYRKTVKDRARWELGAQVNNLTDQTALYNFQSAFVGTRLVQPRTISIRYRIWF
ncbi:TonB-dependent receptor [Bryobacter aggregatus]|uniref:TonB-dependent receptor n=1 Tax=Bryobacter aggregatus TaxID=360054 RepID=UPI0004E0CE66|nr:TonB-dependent receptor [Bryobacter aggregatus]